MAIPHFLETKSSHPIYDIGINLNSKGYRTIEFDKIDYNNSIFLFGCSMTFGHGLTENETISYHLEKLLNIPVINLGVRGSSIIFNVYNQVLLKEINCRPKAIINLWTSPLRHVYFQNTLVNHLGSWTTDIGRHHYTYFSSWHTDQSNVNITNQFNKKIAELIWSDTPHIQATFFPDTADLFGVKHFLPVDRAPDKTHAGPKTSMLVADFLASEYRSYIQ